METLSSLTSFMPPSLVASTLSAAVTNPDFAVGLQQVQTMKQTVEKEAQTVTCTELVSRTGLKRYFHVHDGFVTAKLALLLMPFRCRSWERKREVRAFPHSQARDDYLPPAFDVQAQDLYIPTMALLTYVILRSATTTVAVTGFSVG